MIEADKVTVRIGRSTLVDRISCQVRPGELVCVLGCNGAGKSTLLAALCGDRRFQAGHVTLDGRAIGDYGHAELAHIRAVMPQSVQLGFPFRAREVVAMGRMPFNEPRAQTQEAVSACMALTETQHLSGSVYPTLSGGEKQRVQLARVLSQLWPFESGRPGYLFLDEATASLDPLHQQQVFSLARHLADRGLGVMAVLHDMNLAAQFADRVIVLKNGQVLATGTPDQTLTPERIRDAFNGLNVFCQPDPGTGRPWIHPLRQQPGTPL